VVDNIALRKALAAGALGGAVLDVWEGEPRADRKLIALSDIATPHIAGYSVDGKANGTIAVVRETASHLGIPLAGWQPDSLPMPDKPVIGLDLHSPMNTPLNLAAMAVLHTYPIDEDDQLFRSDPERFEHLRDNYRQRREFSSFLVSVGDAETRTILQGLGFKINND
jgi:erythronate-4-phosphate dehydrogenase